MNKDNPIYAYYQGIKNGSITVSKWITRLFEFLIMSLEDGLFFYDHAKAMHAIKWIEAHCFHTQGDLAPSSIKLILWQRAFTACVFGIVDKDGNRYFREIILLIGRKNGKSKLAACFADYILRYEGGYGTSIYCLAPKLEQADLIYGDVWQMITLDPEYIEAIEALEQARIEANGRKVEVDPMIPKKRRSDVCVPGSNSTIKKIAFSSKKSDGFNPTLTICDEVAAWPGDRGLKQYEVMRSGTSARANAMTLSCTTAGYINDGIYDELMKRATRFLMGESKEKRLLPFLYMIDDVEKWNDINELQKSLPNLGTSISIDFILEEIAIAEGSLSKKSEFITKNCNLKQNSSQAWIPAQTVERAGGEHLSLDDFRGTYCVGGIDLSQTTDLTAATIVIERKAEFYVFTQFFLPAEKIEEATERDGIPYQAYITRGILTPSGDNYVDYKDVFNWFMRLVEEYEIYPLKVGYDRYSAQYLVQDMQGAGFHMDDVYQGENLYPVIQEVEGLLNDARVHIGDNDLLRVHLLDSAVKMSVERGRGKLVKINPSSHIDGTAALLDAFTVRQKYHTEIGEQLKNEEG